MLTMLRFAIPLALMLAAAGYMLSPVADRLVANWFQSDMELRSRLIFSTVRDVVAAHVRDGRRDELERIFRRLSEDERVLGLGLCVGGKLESSSTGWPAVVGCPLEATTRAAAGGAPLGPTFRDYQLTGGRALLSSFPVGEAPAPPSLLLILHDLSFVERRSETTRLYLAALLAGVGLLAALITIAVAKLTLRRWLQSAREQLQAAALPPPPPCAPGEIPPPAPRPAPRLAPGLDPMAPLAGEIRRLMRDIDSSRALTEGGRVDWTPETLRQLLDADLPGAQVIVVSNREPYIHTRGPDGDIVLQRPAGGVTAALEPITRACGGVWIAHGSGSADRDTVDQYDHVPAPPHAPAYTLRRIWLSEEEENGYYYGLANEGLWPLCHICFVRPVLREADWEQYVAVNRKFADAVAAEAKGERPVVLIQDYHFALAPRMVRERLPNAVIVTFWHIPWPNAELFSIFPWRKELLDGLLGSSIIGFHTRFHCNNFIDTVDRFMECRIDRDDASIAMGGGATLVRPYPISIEWPTPAGPDDIAACRAAVRARFNLPADAVVAVGVERLDFTKGIPDRIAAVEAFLEANPEWLGRFVYIQVAAPSRSKLPAYRAAQEETFAMAETVNARFTHNGVAPVVLAARHHEPAEIAELFRAADIGVVTSLHDGMNLVAKEFVAARDDDRGVLILSTFAGASRELLEALIVNPYDTRGMAQALRQAVTMPEEEQRERMTLMRAMVRENNVYRWAGRMLSDAARLRKRQRVADLEGTGA